MQPESDQQECNLESGSRQSDGADGPESRERHQSEQHDGRVEREGEQYSRSVPVRVACQQPEGDRESDLQPAVDRQVFRAPSARERRETHAGRRARHADRAPYGEHQVEDCVGVEIEG